VFIFRLMIFILIGFVLACTQPEQNHYIDRPIVYKMRSQDKVLGIQGVKKVKVDQPRGEIGTAELFQYYRTVKSNLPSAQDSFLAFYQTKGTHSVVKFQDSPYVDFFIAKSKPSFMSATENLDEFFLMQKNGVQQALAVAAAPLSQLPESMGLSLTIQKISDFMTDFEVALLRADIDSSVRSSILGGLYQRFWLKLPATTEIVKSLEGAKDFEAAVASLRTLIGELDLSLSTEQEEQLREGNEIGQMLNQEQLDAQSAYTILSILWGRMTPEERKETFGEIPAEIYSILNKKKQGNRECLRREDCARLVLKLAKNILILPYLKKYGVEKLRQQIQGKLIDSLQTETSAKATEFVREMPEILREEIFKELDAEQERFSGYRKNYEDFIRDETQHWFEHQFLRSGLPALEADRVKISSNGGALLQVKSAVGNANMLTSPNSLGAAMAVPLSEQLIKINKKEVQLLAITRVNQMLAHGGFLKHDGKSFPSISQVLLPNIRSKPLNIEVSLDLPGAFVLPTPARVVRGFDFESSARSSDLSVLGQAQLLRGFTQMILSFKDWQPTSMDKLLSTVQAKDLLPSLPAEGLQESAFPKEALLALAVGNASAILSNLKSKGSSLFIFCSDQTIAWQEEGSEEECKTRSTLASLVDIRNYRRQLKVETAAHAQFLESLLEFLVIAEELKQTKSTYLTKGTGGQKSGIEQLAEALPKLRGLAVGMTNFLSNQLQSSAGGFYSGFDLKNKRADGNIADLKTQLVALRALVSAADFFNLEAYRMSALSNYYFLNREFFDEKTGFYQSAVGPRQKQRPTTLDLALAVDVLGRLKDYPMPLQSKEQWQNLMNLWVNK